MRLLCVSDVHLKPWMFDLADAIMDSGDVDMAIQMGDLVDDWGKECNLSLYSRTLQRAIKFHEDHPDTLWVMGNHDYGYWHPNWGHRESGHSQFAEGEVFTFLKEMERKGAAQKNIHIVDNCIFTHAGLTKDWVERRLKKIGYKEGEKPAEINLIHAVNYATQEELWCNDSPIWARPQQDDYELWDSSRLQIVGHTPVAHPIEKDNLVSTDTFSTFSDGNPLGDEKFIIVDTETTDWRVAEERE